MLEWGKCLGQLIRHLVEECRRQEECVDLLPANLLGEIARRQDYIERQADELGPAQQRTPHLEGRGVERNV